MLQKNTQKVHFIAIGGSVMHNLAIALKQKGFHVTGSDDHIYEPSSSKLQKHGLLPEELGWYPEKITEDLEAVILGMHAREDNPELKKAIELNIKIYSYPEYIYHQSKDKQRVVVAGSHGKTTITSMLIHVLKYYNREIDYLVGAALEGFDNMVKLSDAPIIIIEGDEYFSSPLDKSPKFLRYNHHVGLISGIAWDHVNVFPTYEEYVKQFDIFADLTPKAGNLIYCEEDAMATVICSKERKDVNTMEYKLPEHTIENGTTILLHDGEHFPLQIFGKHNLLNIGAATKVLSRMGLNSKQVYEAMKTFSGAANRLQKIASSENMSIYKDFAHAPSKVEATVSAVKEQYPDRKLIAVLELYTFSSLTKKFLNQYQHTLSPVDVPIVYFNPETIKQKKLELFTKEDIKKAFGHNDLLVFDDKTDLQEFLLNIDSKDVNLLMMSSGNFDGLEMTALSEKIVLS